jgi:murein DD-endopeptidase MepM/ murein hydrolase activator NlpD
MPSFPFVIALVISLLGCWGAQGQFHTLSKDVGQRLGVPTSEENSSRKSNQGMNAEERKTRLDTIANSRLAWPLARVEVTSPRGWRIHPLDGRKAYHGGIDLRANYEVVMAVMDGIVEDMGFNEHSGLWIRLKHIRGIRTSYAHLSFIGVNRGKIVQAGQPIGISGQTGHSTGPHLHFRMIGNPN